MDFFNKRILNIHPYLKSAEISFGLILFIATNFAAPLEVKVTRWISPDNAKPLSFQAWRAQNPSTEFWLIEPIRLPENKMDIRVDLLVESSLLPYLTAQIDTLVADLIRANYAPAVYSVTGSSPESLRNFLLTEYRNGMAEAVLIGNLPIAWFQMIDDWNNNGQRDPDEGYEEFPCELYFMDLDGIWQDNFRQLDTLDSLIPGSDGIFDTHYGNQQPEIGISRMPVAVLGSPIQTLQFYLSKDHRYRNAQLPVRDRALVYIDDDWIPYAQQWNSDVGIVYSDRVFIWDAEQTRALDYRPRIDSAPFQWVGLFAHSWPGGHGWKYNNGQNWDWFWATEIPQIDPVAVFYNLFACSNARFVEPGFCGGRYVFNTSTGLAAIGSTKTGSMLEFQDFYNQLASDKTLSTSFREWFQARIADGFEPWEKSWFYGMCVIGDGLLKIHTPLDVGVERIIRPQGILDSGSVVTPQVKVKNFGNSIVNFEIILKIGTDYEDTQLVNYLNSNDTCIVNFFPWTARNLGTQQIKCTTRLIGDENSANDLLIDSVVIVSGPGVDSIKDFSQLEKIALLQINPNPFISQTAINFVTLINQCQVDLAIYNTAGKLVRSLKTFTTNQRLGKVNWDGKDNDHKILAKGVYFITLSIGKFHTTGKLIKLK